MKPELYKKIVLTKDVPEEGLRAGDVATLVDFAPEVPGEEEHAILDLFNAFGEPYVGVRVPLSAVAPFTSEQLS